MPVRDCVVRAGCVATASFSSHVRAKVMSDCESSCPTGRMRCSTAAQACLSMEASPSAFATGMMGSLAPERMSTGFPVKSACGSWESGTMARSRIAPASTSGRNSSNAAAMFAPFE